MRALGPPNHGIGRGRVPALIPDPLVGPVKSCLYLLDLRRGTVSTLGPKSFSCHFRDSLCIGGSRGRVPHAPLLRAKISSFSCSFGKIGQIVGSRHPRSWCPPLWEILDPPMTGITWNKWTGDCTEEKRLPLSQMCFEAPRTKELHGTKDVRASNHLNKNLLVMVIYASPASLRHLPLHLACLRTNFFSISCGFRKIE